MPFGWCQGESTISDVGEAFGRCIPNRGENQHTAGPRGLTKSTNPPAATSLNPYTKNLPLPPPRQVPSSPQCNCTPSYLRAPTDECFVGDIDHIRDRFMHQAGRGEGAGSRGRLES